MTRQGINRRLEELAPKKKGPCNRSVLDSWIARAEAELDTGSQGRVGWLVATTVATAALQRVVDEQDTALFSLKGGTLLQHRLGLASRSTRDLDGIVRGDVDDFLEGMDKALADDWGPIHFSRSEVRELVVPSKAINPRRFDLVMSIKGQTWRKVAVEISPSEGMAADFQEAIEAPPLDRFGLPSIDKLMGMSISYQIAQKIHASTDPHDPPAYVNNRARDVVDLLLLEKMAEEDGAPSLPQLKGACLDIFQARAEEAMALGRAARSWPPKAMAHRHWATDYAAAAASCGIEVSLDDAMERVNGWIGRIDSAKLE